MDLIKYENNKWRIAHLRGWLPKLTPLPSPRCGKILFFYICAEFDTKIIENPSLSRKEFNIWNPNSEKCTSYSFNNNFFKISLLLRSILQVEPLHWKNFWLCFMKITTYKIHPQTTSTYYTNSNISNCQKNSLQQGNPPRTLNFLLRLVV